MCVFFEPSNSLFTVYAGISSSVADAESKDVTMSPDQRHPSSCSSSTRDTSVSGDGLIHMREMPPPSARSEEPRRVPEQPRYVSRNKVSFRVIVSLKMRTVLCEVSLTCHILVTAEGHSRFRAPLIFFFERAPLALYLYCNEVHDMHGSTFNCFGAWVQQKTANDELTT